MLASAPAPSRAQCAAHQLRGRDRASAQRAISDGKRAYDPLREQQRPRKAKPGPDGQARRSATAP